MPIPDRYWFSIEERNDTRLIIITRAPVALKSYCLMHDTTRTFTETDEIYGWRRPRQFLIYLHLPACTAV